MGKKIIAFSLWGDNPKYCVGAVKNCELALQFYPEWTCRFYVGKSTPTTYITQLIDFKNTEVFVMKQTGNWVSTFWRFLAIDDSSVSITLLRDTDSRLGERERAAVDEWLVSDKHFHIMRDHPGHGTPILAGMWGVKYGTNINFYNEINKYTKKDFYGVDQNFLADIIYPIAKTNSVIHDEFFQKNNFPTKRKQYEFVGERYDENNAVNAQDSNALISYLQNDR
jgi:hypothetical protein